MKHTYVLIGQTRGDELVRSEKVALASSPHRHLVEERMAFHHRKIQEFRDKIAAAPYWESASVYASFSIIEVPSFETEQEEISGRDRLEKARTRRAA